MSKRKVRPIPPRTIQELGAAAKKTIYGSENHERLHNLFHDEFEEQYPHLATDDFDDFCLKATSNEMVDEALTRIERDAAPRWPFSAQRRA